VIAVDDRDDEARGLIAQGRMRRRAMEAERRPEPGRLRLVAAAAGCGEPRREQQSCEEG
jgi:hypothetical protein